MVEMEIALEQWRARISSVGDEHHSKRHPRLPRREPWAAREIGCSFPVRLAFVVVVLVTVVLAGDVESNTGPSCAICETC